MELLAVQTGETIWQEQARLESLAGVPLSDRGREVIRRVAKQLVPHEPTVIYTSPGQAEQETTELLAKQLSLKIRTLENLAELNFGLWQGLTMEEVRHRQPTLHKQWQETPASVRPPGGETLEEAYGRIRAALETIVKHGRKQTPLIVLRPVALALLRCRLERADLNALWQFMEGRFEWVRYEIDPKTY